jgi:hypothetical protein
LTAMNSESLHTIAAIFKLLENLKYLVGWLVICTLKLQGYSFKLHIIDSISNVWIKASMKPSIIKTVWKIASDRGKKALGIIKS